MSVKNDITFAVTRTQLNIGEIMCEKTHSGSICIYPCGQHIPMYNTHMHTHTHCTQAKRAHLRCTDSGHTHFVHGVFQWTVLRRPTSVFFFFLQPIINQMYLFSRHDICFLINIQCWDMRKQTNTLTDCKQTYFLNQFSRNTYLEVRVVCFDHSDLRDNTNTVFTFPTLK